jgi:hypothetical protein
MKKYSIYDQFTQKKMEKYSELFKDLDLETLKSDKNVARTICQLCDKDPQGYSIFSRVASNTTQEENIKKFIEINQTEMNSLGLITKDTHNSFVDSIRTLIHTRNVRVENDLFSFSSSNNHSILDKNNLYNCKQIVIDKFDQLEGYHLPALKKIFSCLEQHEIATSIIFTPYVAAVLTIPLFLTCASTISDPTFYKYLVSRTIFQINKSTNPSFFYGFEINNLIKGLTVSSLVLFYGSSFFGYFNKPIITDLIDPPMESKSHPMDVYKYTGDIGYYISTFKLQSGAVLFSVCDILESYRKILMHHLFKPLTSFIETMTGNWKTKE